MLGTWGKSKYKSIEDFENHKEYLQYIYKGSKGFAARMNIWTDRFGEERRLHKLHHHNILIYKNKYYGVQDVYVSMNSFLTSKSRAIDNLKRLNALYIDLDCYKMGLTREQVLYWLETDYFGKIIPCPTFVIDSGRGLYLIWKISEDRNALPKWKRVQEYFAEKLNEFGADEQALDAARILRVPYSVNTKSNSRVKIIRYNDVRYTLYEIIKEYAIPGRYGYGASKKPVWGVATEKQREYAAEIAAAKGIELPDFNNFNATFEFISGHCGKKMKYNKINSNKQIIEGYLRDVIKVITSRKGENCCREYALFLARMWLCQMTGDYEEALRLTLEINARLDKPFAENYVCAHTHGAEIKIKRGEIYKYRKETIIRKLKITEDEMKNLRLEWLNIVYTAKERKQVNNRKKYLECLAEIGEQPKREKIKNRRERITELLAQNKGKTEICAELKISTRTYDRDRAYIIAHGLLERALNTIKKIAGAAKEGMKKTVKTAVSTISPKIQPYMLYKDNFVVLYGRTEHFLGEEEWADCIGLLE